jgi:mono/diheme cytochrome c family protein
MLLVLLFAAPPVPAPLPAPLARKVDYSRDVRPVLARACFSCHGPEKQRGGLRLDHGPSALAGGTSGVVIKKRDSANSRLIHVVAGHDPAMVMPPGEGKALSHDQVALLRAWIDQGPYFPESDWRETPKKLVHWSFVPIRRPTVPVGTHPIDAFVHARLRAEKLEPSPAADRATQLRRVALDLTGLAPSPEELDAFLADTRLDAYERAVDRLLASPHYGERWGRHWLDLARYADSDGYEKDGARPYAWRYRHWVITALNANMPHDRFLVDQLAGDLRPSATVEQKVATGFHRNTLTNKEGGADKEQFRVEAVIDRVNTTAQAILGLTLGCAQCHDHKYDPLSQRDYYQMFAFFNSDEERDIPAPVAEFPAPPSAKVGTHAPVLVRGKERKTHLLVRGDFLRKGAEVSPGTPAVLPPLQARMPTRLDLAVWLTAPENPLTARVAVNHVWHKFFGRGLVATLDDFGTQGEKPSHPELLDWLASEFVDSGWNLKRLHRLIVTSETYRQSSKHRAELTRRDPYNILLARQARLRLEAELVRDQMLRASGLLFARVGGPSVRPPQPAGIADLSYAGSVKWIESTGVDRYRRGIYTWFQRTSPHPQLLTFDAPEGSVCTVRRERSNTPLQALTLLNDVAFVEGARALGKRVQTEAQDDAERVHRAFRLVLSRPPSEREQTRLVRLLGEFRAADPSADPWPLVARTLLNLDEAITRE